MSSQRNEIKNLNEYILEISKKLSKNTFIDTEKSNIIASFKKNISRYLEECPSKISEIFDVSKQLISDNKKLKKEQTKLQTQNNKLIIYNKDIFNIFPFIFDINPKLSHKYINNFITLINLFISENNKNNFSYLSDKFSEIVNIFFNNIELSIEEKKYIYSQILTFCLNNIKTNNTFEQSFGCLILTELIEKCCLFQKDDNLLETLWNHISKFLEDKWFICKLDILNCALSLIFVSESKFKKYANECLFKILEYLTDSDWMQRKIAINIIYTLIFYCKEEIINVKKNIIEFLTIVKEDPVAEVREACIQTLNYMNEQDQLDLGNDEIKNISIKEKDEISSQDNNNYTINYDLDKENEDELLIKKDNNKESVSNTEKKITDIDKSKIKIKAKNSKLSQKMKKNNKISKNNNSFTKSIKLNNEHITQSQSHSFINPKIKNHKPINNIINKNKFVPYYRPNFINIYNQSTYTATKKLSTKITKKSFNSVFSSGSKKNEQTISQNKSAITNLDQTKKNEQKTFAKNKTSKKMKEFKGDKPDLNKNSLSYTPEVINNININNYNEEEDNIKNQTINYENKKSNIYNSYLSKEGCLTENNNNNINNGNDKNLNEENNNSLNNFEIFTNTLSKIQKKQNLILERLEQLEQKMEDHYSNFDKRIKLIEKDLSDIKQKNIYNTSDNNNDDKTLISIKNKILNGTYDEALAKAIQNDEYLYSILPLLNDVNINFIDASVLEDIISRLSLKLARINKNDDAGIINIILNFFNNLICAGINIRMVVKMNLKDSFEILLNENKDIISKNDIHILNNILDKLKI